MDEDDFFLSQKYFAHFFSQILKNFADLCLKMQIALVFFDTKISEYTNFNLY